MIKAEKSPKFPKTNPDFPEKYLKNTENLPPCLARWIGKGGPSQADRGFSKIFDDHGVFGLTPLAHLWLLIVRNEEFNELSSVTSSLRIDNNFN